MDTHHFQSPAMTDPTRLEPRNGDFVAYVEALQEESLEALRRANQAAIANPLQVPDASEGGADLGRIAAEMIWTPKLGLQNKLQVECGRF